MAYSAIYILRTHKFILSRYESFISLLYEMSYMKSVMIVKFWNFKESSSY